MPSNPIRFWPRLGGLFAGALLLASCGGSAAVSSPSSGAASVTVSIAASAKPSVSAAASAPASTAATTSTSAAAKPSAVTSSAATTSTAASTSAASTTSAAASGAATASGAAAGSGAATGTPIKVGVLNDISGPGSIEGAEQKINTDLAIAQINASGGINGHPLVGDFVDSKGDAATAVQLANQLANQDKVDVLVGGVYSAECLGVEQQVNNYGIAYLPLNACANEQLTSQTCNKLVFRVFPVGGQTLKPPLGYVVKTYGPKWAIITTQNPFGDSQIAATDAAMKDINGQVTVKIQVPVGEANVTPYVTKIPTDGSVNGVLNYENGTDLARVVQVMAQFGVNKLPQLMFLGAESFGGVYPDSVNGAILGRLTLDNPPAGPAADYLKAFKDQVSKEGQVANVLGGNKALPGDLGYES